MFIFATSHDKLLSSDKHNASVGLSRHPGKQAHLASIHSIDESDVSITYDVTIIT